jgi:hypothetical protein
LFHCRHGCFGFVVLCWILRGCQVCDLICVLTLKTILSQLLQ